MTFVGKILIVVQVLFSLLFMAFAGAVYTTHTNWQEKTKSEAENSQKAQAEKQAIQEEFETFKTDATTKINAATEEARRLTAQKTTLEQDLAQSKTALDTAVSEAATYRAQAQLATQEAQDRRDEAIQQRLVNKDLNVTVNTLFAQVRKLDEDLFNTLIDQKSMLAKHTETIDELARAKRVLRQLDIDLESTKVATGDTPPPPVSGLVLDTKKSERGSEFIEISVGSDDGLLEGHNLYVYRTGVPGGDDAKFLGKIAIVHVTPDKAVGTVVERAKNGRIEKGDNVSTRL